MTPGTRAAQVVRVHVYSSLRVGQPVSEQRQTMFDQMRELHWDVHIGSFDGKREKCVDIALAVDMLHYATVQGAFDVAVLVSGDADFLPALVRTRQRGKRVAICSMRNSASSSFDNAESSEFLGLVADGEARLKDFDVHAAPARLRGHAWPRASSERSCGGAESRAPLAAPDAAMVGIQIPPVALTGAMAR
jgi:hypothetical protein